MIENRSCPTCRRQIIIEQCEWVVAEIKDHTGLGRNIKYKVKWESGEETYEPKRNFLGTSEGMLSTYQRRLRAAASRRYRARMREIQMIGQ